jgi:uncharacterized protein YecT (DUF1311 family)
MRGIELLCLFFAAAFFTGIPVQARQHDPFAYKFIMTPEEGPLNPAVEKRYTAAFNQCQKRAVSTSDNEACFNAEFDRQDKILNHAWASTLRRVPPNLRSGLVSAQRKWIAERDQFCNSKAEEFRGGTIMRVVYVDCRVEQTIRRTIWLEKLR